MWKLCFRANQIYGWDVSNGWTEDVGNEGTGIFLASVLAGDK